MTEIVEIHDPDEKSRICGEILRALPDWFGVEASVAEYTVKTRELPFFAAVLDGRAVGFAALRRHNPHTAELCVMGVLAQHHRRGLGRLLVARCEAYARESGAEFLTVKTLDASAESDEYERTRRFYFALGFRPLEVFPLYWNAENPCLFMAKHLGGA